MYETVEIVNGYRIERMKGTQRSYWVTLEDGGNFKKKVFFRTIKAARKFIEENL